MAEDGGGETTWAETRSARVGTRDWTGPRVPAPLTRGDEAPDMFVRSRLQLQGPRPPLNALRRLPLPLKNLCGLDTIFPSCPG